MQRTCKECSKPFQITPEDLSFYEKVSPSILGKRIPVPPPSCCSSCRLQRRLSFRNHIFLYTRTSSSDGKMIFSMYTEDVPFPVISKEEWWSDSWDALSFGREFDFKRSFFEQFTELRNSVPHFPLSAVNMENSDYCNNSGYVKNSYLIFNTNDSEESMYCESIWGSKFCVDCTHTPKSELCYDCVECARCYNLQSSRYSEDCRDSYFLLNCRSCSDCIGCVNLRRARYCIFNQQYTKEEYYERLSKMDFSSYQWRKQFKIEIEKFFHQHPTPHIRTQRVEDVTGNFIYESRNVYDSFLVRGAENVRFGFNLTDGIKDCYDFSIFGQKSELVYQSAVCGLDAFNLRFCFDCWQGVSNLDYCWMCIGSQDCFGCVGLRKKRYCILNKQYSKEQYQELVPKIIEHMRQSLEWGEFFPASLSPIPYNNSYAYRFFPLTKEQVLQKKLLWHEKNAVDTKGAILAAALPDRIPTQDQPIKVLSALSGRPFLITTKEIGHYRKHGIPLPHLSYDERMEQRAVELGYFQLYERCCAKTGKPILTNYAPNSPYIVWDKQEYDREFS
jgi:hypothetical protein